MDKALWDQTIEVALSQGVLTAEPDAAAYTTEYADAALALLGDLDTKGADWAPTEVTLLEGGQ